MKKTVFARLLAFGLVAVMLVAVLASCGGGNQNTGGPVETIAGDEYDPKIPAKDYGGYEFAFICQPYLNDNAYTTLYMVSEAETGDTILDAVYRRNELLKEKYNVTFTQIRSTNVVEDVRKQVLAQAVEFDIIIASCRQLANMTSQDLLYDLNSIDRFDMTKPYWDQNAAEQLTIGDKLYFTNCDLNIQEVAFSVYFNKSLIEELELPNPYELMEKNEWTIDKWAEIVLSSEVAKDMDGNGEQTEMDRYGTLYEVHNGRMFLYGSGVRATTNNEVGLPVVTLFEEDGKAVNVYAKCKEVFSSVTNSWCINDMTEKGSYLDKYDYARSLFCQDLYLFHYEGTNIIHQFADMEHEFGILPFPKYDSNQESYYSMYPYNCAMVGLPNIIEDLERTASIVEDMNYYSHMILKPAWYDTLLSRRYARDDESEASLDIILAGRVYDIGTYFDFGGILSTLLDDDVRTNNISTRYARLEKTINKAIKSTYEDILKAD